MYDQNTPESAQQPLAVEAGASLPNRRPMGTFEVGDRVVPVGNYRPTTLVREGGGVVADTSFIEHHPIRVEDSSGQGYLFRTDELALAGDWETVR